MKKSEIMKIFTAKVAELMAQGMWINGETMRGTQGEICKVDLTDGQRLVRVLLADGRTDFLSGFNSIMVTRMPVGTIIRAR